MTDNRYGLKKDTPRKLAELMAFINAVRHEPPLFRAPSTREMAAEMNCSQNEICRRLGILERQGKITWTPGVSRSVIPALRKTEEFDRLLQEIWDAPVDPVDIIGGL